jgi:hypothetical protein
MATSEAISLVVEARRRPYEWHTLYVHHGDAEAVSRMLVGLLDDRATDPEARPGLLALACQLRHQLRGV